VNEATVEASGRTRFAADLITCVLTSCGRWDLLVQSIDTFLKYHEPGRFILVEDSADHAFAERIRARYSAIEVILDDPRLGQHRAIDKAYGMVTTPYIVHLEDDWFFTGPMDVANARGVLDGDPTIVAVCFSVFRRYKLNHRIHSTRFTHNGRLYARMKPRAHRDWHGFSFYPSLLKRAFWEEYGPYARYPNERTLSRAMKDIGKGVVHQLPGVGIHVGSGRSVFDPARASENRRVTGALWRRLFGKGVFAPTAD
jgi:hypothetical protein